MVTTTAPDSSSNPVATTNFPRKNLTSPWAQVVRGPDSSSSSSSEPLNNQSPPPPPPQSFSSSSSLDSANLVASITAAAAVVVDNNNSNADKINNVVNANPKKPAWKNTSNDLVVAEVSPVMGAVSWPALSAKPSAKLTSDFTSAAGSISISQGPVTSNSPQKQATATTANARHSPPMNHSANRQKPMKRGGGNNNNNEPGLLSNSLSNPLQANHQPSVAPPLPSIAPPFPVLQIPPNTFLVDGVQSYKINNGWGPRSPVGGYGLPVDEHSNRGNYGHRPRNNYGTRRNQDPGNRLNTRDAHAPQHRMHSEGFLRPTLPNSAYLGSQSMRPFLNPAGFHEFYYYPTLQFEPFGGMPFLTHPTPPAMFFPVAEETPPTTPPTSIILKQIDYYFSDVNLANDEFLKSNMDEHGWVSVSLIANFPRVKNLTNNIELILDSLRNSSVVEVNGDKLRKRNWTRFLPPIYQQVGSSSISSVGSTCNNIIADFDKITMDEATVLKNSNATNGDSAGESSSY